jgi:hypothetical protein
MIKEYSRRTNLFAGFWQRACVVMVLVCGTAMPAHAALHEIRVIGIGIDSLRSEAEAKAVDYARKRALYMLARKLNVPQAEQQLQKLQPKEIEEMIRGHTVVRTQRKDDVTYAEVKVSIVDTPLRRLLGLPEKDNDTQKFRRRGVLILGVYMDGERPLLWEKRNPLNKPLKSQSLKMGKGSVIMPVGDPEDLRVVDYNNILTIEYEEMQAMLERYGANEVLVAVVTTGLEGTADPTDILIRRLTNKGIKLERVTVAPLKATAKEEARVQDAVYAIAQVATDLASSVSLEERQALEKADQLPLLFSFITMKEYGDMQDAVRAYPGFKQLDLPSINLHRVQGKLYYDGNEKKLREHLKKYAIFVRPNADGWIISLR